MVIQERMKWVNFMVGQKNHNFITSAQVTERETKST